MVDFLWFVLTLILLAAETVVLVLLLVLRRGKPRRSVHRYPRDAHRVFAAQL